MHCHCARIELRGLAKLPFDPRLLQCLQLSTAQDNVLALRSWLAAFRSGGSGRLPKPRTTKDEEFDEAWSVLLKTLGTQTAVDF